MGFLSRGRKKENNETRNKEAIETSTCTSSKPPVPSGQKEATAMAPASNRPQTLGELKVSGYKPVPIKSNDQGVLDPGNVASARDTARMVRAAMAYPLIRNATTTRSARVRPYRDRGELRFNNTNRLLRNRTWDIQLSKTGYINEAGRCLVMQAEIDDQPLTIVLLDSFGKLTPFGDSNRIRKWIESGR